MTVLRWIIGVLTALLATGAILTFVGYMLEGDDRWLVYARNFRRWVWSACLFWFNCEIWGRVIWTLVHW